MKKILLLIAVFLLSVSVSAQTIVKDAISVNGLKVGERYTQEQFVQALGTPTKIEPPSDDDEYPDAWTYWYGKDLFYLFEGEFYGFELWSPAFVVNGLLRVGDPVSKVDQLGGVKRNKKMNSYQIVKWRPRYGDLYDWLSLDLDYEADGIISYITAFIHDL